MFCVNSNIAIPEEDTQDERDRDWYLEWVLAVKTLKGGPSAMRRRIMDRFSVQQLVRGHESSLCDKWNHIVFMHWDYIKWCNVSVVDSHSEDLWLSIQVIADQHRMNQSEIVRLRMEFETENDQKEQALRQIGESVGSMSGVTLPTAVSVEAFTVSEIPRVESGAVIPWLSWQPSWTSSLGLCGIMVVVIAVTFLWCKRAEALDGRPIEFEAEVMHQIEDLLMEELYERNKARHLAIADGEAVVEEQRQDGGMEIAPQQPRLGCIMEEEDVSSSLSSLDQHDNRKESDAVSHQNIVDDLDSSLSNLSDDDGVSTDDDECRL